MRNLKKFLALVLAMMMTLSLMVTVNAAAGDPVTDLETVTDEFQEAVQVLNGLGIITGYENGEFRPLKNITRAETTALVYRLHSGDAKNVKNNLYSTADNIAKFKDVNPNGGDQWSAGYIGYCANQEIIKGVSADRFNPNGNVTGYQVLAMVLRAIGYGQNGEYEGTGWQTRVATTATKLGLLKNVDDTNYAGTLSAAATRELVAEIVFQAALEPTVTYTAAYGYEAFGDKSLGELNFDLDYSAYTTVDDWGRPGYYWFQDTKHDGKPVPSGSGKNVVATITPKAEQTYTTAIHECDLAHDLGISKSATFDLYVNADEPITNNYLVVATDTTTKVGGQGRLTEVYRDLKNDKMSSALADRVVMIDTFLAQVTGVTAPVKDAAGHVITPAKLTLAVYDKVQTTAKTPNPTTPCTIEKDDDSAWEYSKGDMILLNAYTDKSERDFDVKDGALRNLNTNTGLNHLIDTTAANKAAYEPNRILTDYNATAKTALEAASGGTSTPDAAARDAIYTDVVTYAEVLGLAKYTVAQQSVVYWNQEKHNVGGTDYDDNLCLFLDVAGTTTKNDFTWYFDQYGNIIGIGEAIKSNYGVITSIYSSFNTADGSTNGEAVARAHVKYADGTEGDITIDRFLTSTTGTLTAGHNTTMTDAMNGTAGSLDNSAELIPVYDYALDGGKTTMTANNATGKYTKPDNVEVGGHLYVSPVASINANIENDQNGNNYFGIIKGNLFKFISSGDGKMTAMEVAGTSGNTDIYVNNYNGTFNADAGATPTDAEIALRTLYKNGGYLSVNSPSTTIRLDNDTMIMVKDGDKNINVYKGLSALPANVVCAASSEVDWADPDGDGIAEVVYVTGEVSGTVVYGLFYYNGGAAQWNGAEKKGTLAGYLNGEETTLTFANEKLFNIVMNSKDYVSHIFGVYISGGEVTNLFGTASATTAAKSERFLTDATNGTVDDEWIKLTTGLGSNKDAMSAIVPGTTNIQNTNAADFKVGPGSGNDYTADTHVAYFHDDNDANNTGTDASYNAAKNTVTLNATEYALTGSSKIRGNDLSYLNTSRINDITIVFEKNTIRSIVEIYVTTEPDVTSGGNGVTFGPDIQSVPAGLTGTDDPSAAGNTLAKYIKGFAGVGGVFYCDYDKVDQDDLAGAGNMIYVPFISTAGSGAATMMVYSSDGQLRYSEYNTLGAGNVGANIWRFDFLNAPGSWVGETGLSAGTYTYDINVNGTSVSSGTFTLIVE